MYRQAIFGQSCGLLGDGGWGALRLRHHAFSQGFGSVPVGIIEQHGRQTLPHMPFEIIGQHAEEDVRPHPVRQPVMDGPDLQIDGFDAAKGPLDIPFVMPLKI